MSREIISARDVMASGSESDAYNFDFTPKSPTPEKMASSAAADGYTTRLLKYVPAEVVVLFLTLDAHISPSNVPQGVYWVIFVFCLVGTYFYLWRVAKIRKQSQLLISTVAFAVWVFALGGPFAQLDWYAPIYGAVLLPIFTFGVAVYEA